MIPLKEFQTKKLPYWIHDGQVGHRVGAHATSLDSSSSQSGSCSGFVSASGSRQRVLVSFQVRLKITDQRRRSSSSRSNRLSPPGTPLFAYSKRYQSAP